MLTAAQVLAENNFGDTRTGGLAGPMGLFLILLLATATILLIRNMNARLRRLPDRFPQQARATDPTRADATVVDPTGGTGASESSPHASNGHQQHRNG
ncbi:hypothetical protein ACWD6L_17180 [Micromonospora profundi]|uniref:Uncharacterized protein n=1 Tax=Micromonospora profundi TaxID=1420889 RepID=A0AAJ6L2U8_9ACTN|nr:MULTISPECIES: hypothetical protein [Micromonospora]KOX09087.1 hypothetical protein ADK66_13485 [Micromonospora sp. NRRL B-16802]WLS46155.1 hypothetical protein Q3V37_02375 [Micromonospora profundi]